MEKTHSRIGSESFEGKDLHQINPEKWSVMTPMYLHKYQSKNKQGPLVLVLLTLLQTATNHTKGEVPYLWPETQSGFLISVKSITTLSKGLLLRIGSLGTGSHSGACDWHT